MSQMSRAQRLLTIYIVLKILKPRIIQHITKLAAGAGGASSFSELTGTIADAQTPNTILKDGTRAMTGDFDLAGNKLLTTNLLVKELNADYLIVRNRADTADKGFRTSLLSSAYGIAMYWYPSYIRGYPSEALGEVYFHSYVSGAYQKAAIMLGGIFSIPRAGHIVPIDGSRNLGDASHYWDAAYISRMLMDTNDFIDYDITNNRFRFYIGNVCRGYVDATGFHDGAPP